MILKHRLLAVFLIGCLAFLLHADAINNQFALDDHLAIQQNPTITDSGSPLLILTTGFWGSEKEQYIAAWRPFATLTLVLNHAVGGLDPAGYHLANILLHAVMTILVILLGERLGLSRIAALITGAFFAVHPVHVDAVAPAVGRADLLLGIMSISAVLLWENERYVFAFLALALALLSKETGAATLGALLFRAWTRDGLTLSRPLPILRTALLLILAVAWFATRYQCVGWFVAETNTYLENPVAQANWTIRFWTAGALYTKALSLFAFPITLLCEYSFAAVPPVVGPAFSSIVGWILFIGTFLGMMLLVKRKSAVAVAVALWLGGFLLVSNLVLPMPMIFAERVLYLPSAGLFIALGFAADKAFAKPALSYVILGLAAAACVCFGARTVYRIKDWRNDITLLEASVRDAPTSVKHLTSAATILFNVRRISKETALDYIQRALAVKEDHPRPHLAAAQIYTNIDEREKARSHIERAERIDPAYPEIPKAECMFAAKYEPSQAVRKCRKAVNSSPKDPVCWGFLAISLDNAGKPEKAAVAFRKAVKTMRAPDNLIYFNFGVFLARNHQYTEARKMFAAILEIDPSNHEAKENLSEIDNITRTSRTAVP